MAVTRSVRRALRPIKSFARRLRLVDPVPVPREPVRPVVPDVPLEIATDGSADFVWRATRLPDVGPVPWLDRPGALATLPRLKRQQTLTADEAELCRQWITDGYVIVRGLLDRPTLDRAWEAYETRIANDQIPLDPAGSQGPGDELPGRSLNPHWRVPEFRDVLEDRRLVDVVELLLGVEALPFQTISGHKASQQPFHSDSIHMTTYPRGYLVANWIAFEDIEADSGPLQFVPGSNRLPTVYADDVGIVDGEPLPTIYAEFEEKYTPHITMLAESQARPVKTFTASAGDVLFWHANLLHGGSMRTNYARSRKALVCHYFAKGCVCYHDLTGTLSYVHV